MIGKKKKDQRMKKYDMNIIIINDILTIYIYIYIYIFENSYSENITSAFDEKSFITLLKKIRMKFIKMIYNISGIIHLYEWINLIEIILILSKFKKSSTKKWYTHRTFYPIVFIIQIDYLSYFMNIELFQIFEDIEKKNK